MRGANFCGRVLKAKIRLCPAMAKRQWGFAQRYPSFSSVALARTYILSDLFVKASARRKREGKLLLLAAAEFAESSGAVRLTLSTGRDNVVAQALYGSAGWQRDEQFFVYHRSIASGRAENKNFPQPD